MQSSKYQNLKFSNRIGTNCDKWDGLLEKFGKKDLIAAWVADMDIEAPECVQNALVDAVNHNVYGYYKSPGLLNKAFIEWERSYHAYDIREDWIRFSPGVVQSIFWLIQTLTNQNDSVAILEPVYYPFRNAIEETERFVCSVPLVNNDGKYSIDFDAFETALVKSNAKLHIMCSPHNPVGRVWTKNELKTIMDICLKHGVYVIADEIHQDLIINSPEENIPAAVVGSEGQYDSILITLTSASKSFNLAGMQNSFVIIPNKDLRTKFDNFSKKIHINDGGNMGYISYTAAYMYGRDWLLELRSLIRDNANLLRKIMSEEMPKAVLSPLEGTYLQWMDLTSYADIWESKRSTIRDFVVNECGIAPDFGEWFGGKYYKNFIRLNLATSPDNIEKIANRLVDKLNSCNLDK